MNIKQTVIIARSYIERGWCQGETSRDAEGEWVEFKDEAACTWCALGSIDRALWDLGLYNDGFSYENLRRVEDCLSKSIGIDDPTYRVQTGRIGSWNDRDDMTQEKVLQAFTKAIDLAGEETDDD